MKRSKFSEQRIAFILRQEEEGTRVEEVCRKAGISQQTYYRWREKYGGLMPSEIGEGSCEWPIYCLRDRTIGALLASSFLRR